MKNERFSRRALLAGLGASAAMLPLLDAEPAQAATPTGYPKRLVSVVWTNGCRTEDFFPKGTELTFGQTLKPLEPWKAKILMPAHLDLTVVLKSPGGRDSDGHFTYPSILTGMAEPKSEGRTGMGPSIDQFISEAISKTVTLKAPLLNLGQYSGGDGNPTTWRKSGEMNVPETDMYRVFDTLFAGQTLPTGQIDALRARRQSVLDH